MDIPKQFPLPYFAVIFSSRKKHSDDAFTQLSDYLDELVLSQPGYLGHETVGSDPSITISYWKDLDAIKNWRENPEHAAAIKKSKELWFKDYSIRIAEVQRDYYWESK
ncbi:MAG: antibiotic biosynthesis monooxygenase family protein [Luteibaculum sp.]